MRALTTHAQASLHAPTTHDTTHTPFMQIQQLVAGNCHLHRPTDQLIADFLERGYFTRAEEPIERYIVPRMWPIAQQASGVLVR